MGGQIYNAATENEADKGNSPAGTLWVLGTTADLSNLVFKEFRAAVDKPRLTIGKDLVLLLEGENIAIDLSLLVGAKVKEDNFHAKGHLIKK